MAGKEIPYDDSSEWEDDCGHENFCGEVNSPHYRALFDHLIKQAYPEGKEAFLKQQEKEQKEHQK